MAERLNHLERYVDPSITLAGDSIRRPAQPSMGPLPPAMGSGEQFANWLAAWGLPRWQADRIGALAPFTPMGGAFDAGQMIGQGIEERNALLGGAGTGLAVLAAVPGAKLAPSRAARWEALGWQPRSSDWGLASTLERSPMTLGRHLEWQGPGRPIIDWRHRPNFDAGAGWQIEDGRLIFRGPNYGLAPDSAAREIVGRSLNSIMEPNYTHFWRGTNNRDEIDLIRQGSIRQSRNHADNTMELGLSVADDPAYIGTMYGYGYPIRGRVIGTGADGEPLLDVGSLIPLARRVQPSSAIMRRDMELREAWRRANDIPEFPTVGISDIDIRY